MNFKLIFLLTLILSGLISNSQTIEVEGDITENTTWSADTVKIIGNINVFENVVLTILPGTYIEAQGFYHIQSFGSIMAIGSPSDSIYFSVDDTTGFWADTTSNAGGWDGIHLENGSNSISRFEYCNMAYGKQYYSWPDYPTNMGGALLRVKYYGSIYLNNSRFHDNMLCFDYGVGSNSGGVIYSQDVDTIKIGDNVFSDNRTFDLGAAISITTECPNTTISNNLFIRNIAYFFYIGSGWITEGGGAAAIHCSDAFQYSPTIIGNRCFNNRSEGGGVIYTSNLNSIVANNIVCNNDGPGIWDGHNLAHGRIFNNITVNNYSVAGGIGIFSKSSFYNNIVFGNYWHNPDEHFQIFIYDFSEVDPTLFNNCVEFGRGGTDSITDYPEFVNPTEGPGREYDGLSADWTLLETSPCINRGTPDTTGLNLPEFDIDGNPRVFGGRIDIGAYENQSVYVKINDSPVFNEIKLYPNPGSDQIYIDIPPEINGSWIDIVDGQGKILMHEQIQMSPAILSPYRLNSGIYYYRIYNEAQVIKSGKWVKR